MRTSLTALLSSRVLRCALVAALTPLASRAQAPARPFPQHTPLAPGVVRPSNHTQAELDADVRAAYDRWKASYLVAAGTEPDGHPRYRVRTDVVAAGDTVSEGQGYGLVIVALLAGHDANARTLFDGLWEFAHDHPSTNDARLMDWHVPLNEAAEPGDDDSAFDGDADIAYALLLADAQWRSGGRVDYRHEFELVCGGLLASTVGPQSLRPLLGDWCPVSGSPYNQWTNRSSDFLPSHFKAFAAATLDPSWSAVHAACVAAAQALQANYAPVTGLLPDFLVPISTTNHAPKPAPANFLEGPTDGAYSYNAGRDPWRFGADAVLSGDLDSAAIALAMTRWAAQKTGGDPALLRAGYKLDGTNLAGTNYFTSFFAAPLGVAAMNDASLQSWLDALYDSVRLAQEGYYEDSVTLQCLIVMSGNAWVPTPFRAKVRAR